MQQQNSNSLLPLSTTKTEELAQVPVLKKKCKSKSSSQLSSQKKKAATQKHGTPVSLD